MTVEVRRDALLRPRERADTATKALSYEGLVRSAWTGVLFGGIAIAAPLTARLAFGVLEPGYFCGSLLSLGSTLLLGVLPTVFVTRTMLARGRTLGVAIVAGLLTAAPVMVVSYVAWLGIQRAFPAVKVTDPHEPQTVTYAVATAMADAIPLLVAWAGLVFTPALVRAHEERAKKLDAVTREAELLRLRSHLEPHFVLNTMGAIAGLVTEDPGGARELLGMLGDVFRDATDSAERHTVNDELAWLARFVKIHELRFPDQLEAHWEVDDDARAYLVPNLILQPLVENALLHGALRVASGRLTVRVALTGETLVLEVRDNGPSLGPRRDGGKGIALVERRLALEATPGQLSLLREGDETVARVILTRPKREGST